VKEYWQLCEFVCSLLANLMRFAERRSGLCASECGGCTREREREPACVAIYKMRAPGGRFGASSGETLRALLLCSWNGWAVERVGAGCAKA